MSKREPVPGTWRDWPILITGWNVVVIFLMIPRWTHGSLQMIANRNPALDVEAI